jgi:hypothetical protein
VKRRQRFFYEINTLLSPFHGLMFINVFPQAKAWGYLLLPLRGEIRTIVIPRVVQKPVDHRGRPGGGWNWRFVLDHAFTISRIT